MKPNRREAIKMAAALPLAMQKEKLRLALFFTPEEFRAVEELTEMIIPADDHSPGARAAKVTDYIDRRLVESFDAEPRKLWRDGLAPYLNADSEKWLEMLTAAAEHEDDPKTDEARFFVELKGRTVRAYYSSDIGIHKDMEYKGNVYLDESVGYDGKEFKP